MYRGIRYFQIPGKHVGTVRRRLVRGPPECWEGTPSMELDGEATKKGGVRTVSVRNVLLGGGSGSITL